MKKATLEEKNRVKLAGKTLMMIWSLVAMHFLHKFMRKLKMNDRAQKLADKADRVCEKIIENTAIIFPEMQNKEC